MKQQAGKSSEPALVWQRDSLFVRIVRDRTLHLMILPALLTVILFKYFPMYGIIVAFKDFSVFKGVLHSPWATHKGLEHFIDFVGNPDAWIAVRNTVAIAVLKLLILSFPPVILAIMLNEMHNGPAKKLFQTVSYLPHFIAWVVVAGMIQAFLNVQDGVLNVVLVNLGIVKESVPFLTSKAFFWPLAITSDIWKGIGWGSIIYLGVIATIDPNLYEAAEMDGAGRLRQAFHITWPHLMATFLILFILACGRIMSGLGDTFEQSYLLGNSLNRDVSDVLDTYILRVGLEQGRYSFATAVGLMKSVVNLALLLSANWLSRRLTSKGLF